MLTRAKGNAAGSSQDHGCRVVGIGFEGLGFRV